MRWPAHLRDFRAIHVALALCAFIAVGAAPCRAGMVQVTVRDTHGVPMDNVRVVVHARPEDVARDRSLGRHDFVETTDIAGHANISVLPGRWVVDAFSREGRFVAPSENPRHPPVPIEVTGPGDVIPVELVLVKGGRIRSLVECNRDSPAMVVQFQSVDGPTKAQIMLREGVIAGETALLPGRWHVRAAIPPGWLLVGLSVNGEELAGSDAVLAVEEDAAAPIHLGVALEGMAWIGGGLGIHGSGPCPGRVTAILVEAGPWLAAAEARGGSEFRNVPTRKDPRTCTWEAILPSGTWRFEVDCGDRCVVTPDSPVLALAAGESRTLDFTGSQEGGPGGAGPRRDVNVTVLTPDGLPAVRALVEAWPLGDGDGSVTPIGGARTDQSGLARISVKSLPGALRLVAGHADHLDAERAVAESDEAGLTITLAPSAGVAIAARDADARPLAGVEVTLRPITEPADLIHDEALRKHRRGRSALSDAEGGIAWRGLYGGRRRRDARSTSAHRRGDLRARHQRPPGGAHPRGARSELR